MMDRKDYQDKTLATLAEFAARCLDLGPAPAFAALTQGEQYYRHQGDLGQTPYVCLRIPTGGGKTVMAADAIPLLRGYLDQDYPLTLWLVPSTTILTQTLACLRDPQHPYRERLNAQFGIDRLRVLRLDEVTGILPQEIKDKALIVVTTTQALRISKDKKDTRKVYGGHEDLEPTFARLPGLTAMERDADGQVLTSFVNLCHAWRPLVIVDEAHNVRTPLSFDTLVRFASAFILELTATPATDPRTGSNVLARVTARELRDENMIKLPVVVTEYGGDWRATVAGAVRERASLEELARQDGRGIRPIALYQAERKDERRAEVVSPEVIRDYLIQVEGIPEEQIAIATGSQRDIDGVDLFQAACPIRHIITVQALKEGWDCAWAYVLCSVANIHSAKDIEQLLGRVLRMPNAQASRFEPLNRAYAHVTHGQFQSTAAQLRDALVTLGFDRSQANEAIQTPLLPPDDGDLLALRRGTQVTLPGPPPDLDGLSGAALAGISILQQGATGTRISIDPATSPEAIDRLCDRLPDHQRQPVRDAYRAALDRRCPAERGQSLRLPLLAWRQGELIYGEATTSELRQHGRFATRDCPPQDCPWSPDTLAMSSEIDADVTGNLVLRDGVAKPMTQASLAAGWDRDRLIYLLARDCQRPDTTEAELLVYITAWVAHLEKALGLPPLLVHKNRLPARLTECLNRCAEQAAHRGMRDLLGSLDDPASPLTIATEEVLVAFTPQTTYAPATPYRGRLFTKHLYPTVGEMNQPEAEVAVILDALPEVELWLRNLDRHPNSFRLPCPSHKSDWFYPDFLARLTDGRLLVLEYKGSHLEDQDQAKRQIGLAWQRAMKGQGLFLWIGDAPETAQGRSIAEQIRAGLK